MSNSRLRQGAAGAITALALLAVAFVGNWEGLKLYAYKDVVGVWTACYGETAGIKPGMKFTKEQCDVMFIDSLAKHERALRRCLKAPDAVPMKTYVAMLSLAYNIGEGGFCKSSVARRWNAGDQIGACDAFMMWNKAGGRVVQGLTNRRKAERKLCIDGLDEPVTIVDPPAANDNEPAVDNRPVLRAGTNGGWVRILQEQLNVHGAELEVDASFGPKTKAAVQAFQRARGLLADGVVGSETWRALDEATATKKEAA